MELLFGFKDSESGSACGVDCEQCAREALGCGSECPVDECAVDEAVDAAPLKVVMLPPTEPVPVVEVSYGAWESHEYVRERRQKEQRGAEPSSSEEETPKQDAETESDASTDAGSTEHQEEFAPMTVSVESAVDASRAEETSLEATEATVAPTESNESGPREGFAYSLDPFSAVLEEAIERPVAENEERNESESSSSVSSGDTGASAFFWDFESIEQVDAPAEPDA